MRILTRKLPRALSILGVGALTAGYVVFGAINASASTNATCSGGTIAPGPYRSLTIAGACTASPGVAVERNVTIQPGASLYACYGGLSVGRDVLVGSGASLCLAGGSVGHGLFAEGAKQVLVYATTIWGEVAQVGGGGGIYSNFSVFDGDWIHGDVSVHDVKTFWLGFNHNYVWGTVNFNNNQNGDTDGNDIVGNTISGDLACYENSPAPDNDGGNTVFGTERGQCLGV